MDETTFAPEEDYVDYDEPEEVEFDGEGGFPYNVSDYSDDGDALASAGLGTDEDYNHYEWED